MLALPRLTPFDPPAGSEGTLDPLGLYQIADQLATRLVPAVRERMQRIRFLTAMAVGAQVTDGLEVDPEQPDCPPHLIWEWLVVEALVRKWGDEGGLRGVPGSQVTRRALADYGYLDARSYRKTPRIFGFHGVYKRLAVHLGLVDVHLGRRPESETLVDAWARDQGYQGLREARAFLQAMRDGVQRGLSRRPCRTRPAWKRAEWDHLATAFLPEGAGVQEKAVLHRLLHATDEKALGALPAIWNLQDDFKDDEYGEEVLHARLKQTLPSVGTLLDAIGAYEEFCRSLQDGFDLLRASAGTQDARGFLVSSMANDPDFVQSLDGLEHRYSAVHQCLDALDVRLDLQFAERFGGFSKPLDAAEAARQMCEHHEAIQKGKGAEGKRNWFDRLGPDRIYLRHRYRESRREPEPGRFVHAYRARPIRDFYTDLR